MNSVLCIVGLFSSFHSILCKIFVFIHFFVFILFSPVHLSCCLINPFLLFSFLLSCPFLLTGVPPFPLSSSSSRVEEHSSMYLMVPKPLDSFNLLKVKGKVLKQKVLHASCEWYV